MILYNCSFKSFAAFIRNTGKKIIFFGAGTMLSGWMPYILDHYELPDSVDYCLDNNPAKWNSTVMLGNDIYRILSPDVLTKLDMTDRVILITSSYFETIIRQLSALPHLKETACFIAPVMHISNKAEQLSLSDAPLLNLLPQIPKVIHYCWFGRKKLPDFQKKCIDSWRMHSPSYEIMEWNEDNYDICLNPYMKQAYDAGYYGFVPDYARVDLLCKYGGFYFDTDVELLKPLEPLRYHNAFCSFEEYPMVNLGGGSGCVPDFPLMNEIRQSRKNAVFTLPSGGYNLLSCGCYETLPLWNEGLRLDGSTQNIKGMTVYRSEFFHPRSTVTGKTEITPNTIAVHKFNWSWVDSPRLNEMQDTHSHYKKIRDLMHEL